MSPKRRSGHYCWSCDRMRANEKFSGRGHAQHLCKDCARLGKDELVYRQAIRNMERLLTWEGQIPRQKRSQFRKYMKHKDERIRTYARQMEAADALERAAQRVRQDDGELPGELVAEEDIFPLEGDPSPDPPKDDADIPF